LIERKEGFPNFTASPSQKQGKRIFFERCAPATL
jgi:hypothetical protein